MKTTLLLGLLLTLASGFGVAQSKSSTKGLAFHVVSKEKIEGSRQVQTEIFPKLGYVKSEPDLVCTELRSIERNFEKVRKVAVGKDGKSTESVTEEINLIVTLMPDDAKKFESLTSKSFRKHIAILLGDEILNAPMVNGPIRSGLVFLPFDNTNSLERIEKNLKPLVRNR